MQAKRMQQYLQKIQMISIIIQTHKYHKMKAVIETILAQKVKSIPTLPKNITEADVKVLEQAVRSSIGKKVQPALLKLLLAEAYQHIGSDKFGRQISDIGFQSLLQTPYQIEARLRICGLITDAYDESKLDVIKFHFNQLNVNPAMSEPSNKNKLDVIKAGVESIKSNYYKAAIAYFNASKDEVLAKQDDERIRLIEKSITMCFLAQKNKELHQLICQLYINSLAKKSQLYFLLVKLYSETIIDKKESESIQNLFPSKFSKGGSDNISILSKAIFIHNMIPILKSFESISLQLLSEFTAMKEDDLLAMIEKSFSSKEIEIDQVGGYLYIKEDKALKDKILVKTFFDSLETLLPNTGTVK